MTTLVFQYLILTTSLLGMIESPNIYLFLCIMFTLITIFLLCKHKIKYFIKLFIGKHK